MLKIKDTRLNQVLPFEPLHAPRVNMFVCGPTVYDHAHIGHARTFLAFDIIARYIRFRGYSLFYVMNITDVDDKIINRAREQQTTWDDIATKYTQSFLEDMEKLGMKEQINIFAKATDYIPEIINQTQRLIENKHAYITESGVYYDVSSFKDYGKLSKTNLESLYEGVRKENLGDKKDPKDFVLWKKRDPNDKYEPAWDSPWGPGRPGWHIEDTAITETLLGEQYDIHGGAIELIFPHHEAEIAQMEGASGKSPLVKYWLHSGLLTIQGEKMSKSLKNFITIKEAVEKWGSNTLRMFVASAHYRSPIEFSEELLDEAKEKTERLLRVITRVEQEINKFPETTQQTTQEETWKQLYNDFIEAMDNDFNTPKAMAVLFDYARYLNKALDEKNISKKEVKEAYSHYKTLIKMLGFTITNQETSQQLVTNLMKLLIKIRNELRKNKQFDLSDTIRDELKIMGIQIEDKGKETTWFLKTQ